MLPVAHWTTLRGRRDPRSVSESMLDISVLWKSPRIVEGSGYAARRVRVVIFSYAIGARQPQWL
jgi:hypothetical protein